jgi:hypothetical protein
LTFDLRRLQEEHARQQLGAFAPSREQPGGFAVAVLPRVGRLGLGRGPRRQAEIEEDQAFRRAQFGLPLSAPIRLAMARPSPVAPGGFEV